MPDDPDMTPTEYVPPPGQSGSASDEERFPPGTVVGGRYRIAGLLGHGGMGEVYRATDLVLRQPVALKFLPQAASAAQPAIDRLLEEVRIARQISHPNVCRVYDIGIHEGTRYISMEFVDGEDLASLLRRIGRLSQDKALEFARRISAGLAAAHDKGVLHRDLKPANIMIDGAGQVRVMDFGLAGWSGQFQGTEIRSGTPGYMAPEQLRGAEVTVRSDIYSLGVVFYEMFTGKRAFEATSIAELSRLQSVSSPASPASVVRDLDPAVERVIMRCLEPEPAHRPPSALAVAAALPGGDPLAAALAAGETPSPEMVAAAGEAESVSPRLGFVAFVVALAGIALTAVVNGRVSIVARTPMDSPPAALAGRAREILRTLGYTERPADTAYGLDYQNSYLRYLSRLSKSPGRWSVLSTGQPAPVSLWYRTSLQDLEPAEFFTDRSFPGVISPSDPPLTRPGMTLLTLDMQGRLLGLRVVTPQREESPGKSAPPDWNALFTAAGLDHSTFKPAEPEWLPLAAVDARAAWTGTIASGSAKPIPLRVEAASFRGRPVFFRLIWPWTSVTPGRTRPPSLGRRAGVFLAVALLLSGVLAACGIAHRNVRLGRGDRRGSGRLAAFVFALTILAWALGANHMPALGELGLLIMAICWAAFYAGLAWILYLALEPYARRLWPQSLISWTRFLGRGWRDPLIARDILFGIAAAMVLATVAHGRLAATERFGGSPFRHDLSSLLGVRELTAFMVGQVAPTVASVLLLFLLILGLRALLRRQWLASAAFIVLIGASRVLQSPVPAVDAVFQILALSFIIFILVRLGLLVMIVMMTVAGILLSIPLTLDFSAWYAGQSLFALLLVAALAGWAFRTALAGRPLFLKD